jgi:hypothetical protein
MKEFTLVVTEQELNILSAGLTELPYKHCAALIAKLQGQVSAQSVSDAPLVEP